MSGVRKKTALYYSDLEELLNFFPNLAIGFNRFAFVSLKLA